MTRPRSGGNSMENPNRKPPGLPWWQWALIVVVILLGVLGMVIMSVVLSAWQWFRQ